MRKKQANNMEEIRNSFKLCNICTWNTRVELNTCLRDKFQEFLNISELPKHIFRNLKEHWRGEKPETSHPEFCHIIRVCRKINPNTKYGMKSERKNNLMYIKTRIEL